MNTGVFKKKIISANTTGSSSNKELKKPAVCTDIAVWNQNTSYFLKMGRSHSYWFTVLKNSILHFMEATYHNVTYPWWKKNKFSKADSITSYHTSTHFLSSLLGIPKCHVAFQCAAIRKLPAGVQKLEFVNTWKLLHLHLWVIHSQ